MKPDRISDDGIGCRIWWYANGCRIVKTPADHSTRGFAEYRCEIAMVGPPWDYHRSPTQHGPTYRTWQRAKADVAKAAEIRRTWHASRELIRRRAIEHQPMTYQESVAEKLRGYPRYTDADIREYINLLLRKGRGLDGPDPAQWRGVEQFLTPYIQE